MKHSEKGGTIRVKGQKPKKESVSLRGQKRGEPAIKGEKGEKK